MIDVNLYWGSRNGSYRMGAVQRAGETILIDRALWRIQRVEWSLDVRTTVIAVNVRCVPDSPERGGP